MHVVVELQELENLSAILRQKFFYFLSLLSCLKIINGFENSSPECVFSSMTPLVEQSEAEPTEWMYIFAQKTCLEAQVIPYLRKIHYCGIHLHDF